MRHLYALIPILLWSATARAGEVGIVVNGDSTIQPQLVAQLEDWLRGHAHAPITDPLPADALNSLTDCFVIEDTTCATTVVAQRAKTTAVVVLKVDLQGTGDARDLTLTGHWLERGTEPVTERRTCEQCSDAKLRATTDELMTALVGGRAPVGQLRLTSTPAGARVAIDGEHAGTTPLAIALPTGDHVVTITHDATATVTRTVTITNGGALAIEVPLDSPAPIATPAHRHRLPLVVIGAGGALLVTGLVLYATSQEDDGTRFEYRDTKALGATLGVVGLAAAGAGVYLYLRGRNGAESAPIVAVTPGGGLVGWAGAF